MSHIVRLTLGCILVLRLEVDGIVCHLYPQQKHRISHQHTGCSAAYLSHQLVDREHHAKERTEPLPLMYFSADDPIFFGVSRCDSLTITVDIKMMLAVLLCKVTGL
jgi:hypothetical protein